MHRIHVRSTFICVGMAVEELDSHTIPDSIWPGQLHEVRNASA
jgi:hypothetical protein